MSPDQGCLLLVLNFQGPRFFSRDCAKLSFFVRRSLAVVSLPKMIDAGGREPNQRARSDRCKCLGFGRALRAGADRPPSPSMARAQIEAR